MFEGWGPKSKFSEGCTVSNEVDVTMMDGLNLLTVAHSHTLVCLLQQWKVSMAITGGKNELYFCFIDNSFVASVRLGLVSRGAALNNNNSFYWPSTSGGAPASRCVVSLDFSLWRETKGERGRRRRSRADDGEGLGARPSSRMEDGTMWILKINLIGLRCLESASCLVLTCL